MLAAIAAAHGGAVEEGSVGAGTGTVALGWKGGIGTASRKLPASLSGYTVGALVQTNFGGVLTIDGVRVGEALGRFAFQDALEKGRKAGDGSCMIVLATDAPLSSAISSGSPDGPCSGSRARGRSWGTARATS